MYEHLSMPVRWTLGGIVAALAVSNVILWLAKRIKRESDFEEVTLRLRTWWMIVGLFGLVLIISQGAAVAFFAFISFLALKEFLSLVPTRRADHRVLFWAYLAIIGQYLLVYFQQYSMFIVFIPIFMFLWLPTRTVMIGDTNGFLRATGTLHWGLMTTVFSLSHAAYLLMLSPAESAMIAHGWTPDMERFPPGPGLLVLLVLLTQFNDVAQFCWGKAIGRIRVVPNVSPGKTLGGVLGGVFSTVVLSAFLAPWLTFIDLPRAIMTGLIISISGFAGDVSISALKRDLGVKDSGFSLPGHGGILDRVDSLTFTAPLFFHFVMFCYC